MVHGNAMHAYNIILFNRSFFKRIAANRTTIFTTPCRQKAHMLTAYRGNTFPTQHISNIYNRVGKCVPRFQASKTYVLS